MKPAAAPLIIQALPSPAMKATKANKANKANLANKAFTNSRHKLKGRADIYDKSKHQVNPGHKIVLNVADTKVV